MSEQPYTPTTNEVRAKFSEGYSIYNYRDIAEGWFDRWLDQVKAEAFDEGWKARAARDPLVMNIRGHSAPPPPHGLNPYRQGADQ